MVNIITPPITKKNKKSTNTSNSGSAVSTRDLTNEDDAYDAIFSGDFGSLNIGSFIGNADPDDGSYDATEHLPDAIDFEDEDELADDEDDIQNNNNNNNNNNSIIFMNNNENDQISVSQHIFGVSNELILDHHQSNTMDDIGFPGTNTFDHLDINNPNMNMNIGISTDDISNTNTNNNNNNDNNSNINPNLNLNHDNDNNNNNALFMIDNNISTNDNENDNSHTNEDINVNNNRNSNNNLDLNGSESLSVTHINNMDLDLTNGYPKIISFNNDNNSNNNDNSKINQNKLNDAHSYNLFDLMIQHNNNNNNINIQDSKIRNPSNDEDMKKFKERRDSLLLQYYFPTYKKGKVLKWNSCIYRRRNNYQYQSKLLVSLLCPNGNMDEVKSFCPTNLKFKVQQDQKRLFNNMDYSTLFNESKRKLKNYGIKCVPVSQRFSDPLVETEMNSKDGEAGTKNNEIVDNQLNTSDDLLIAIQKWDENKIIHFDSDNNSNKENSVNTNKLVSPFDYNEDWNEDDLIDAKLSMAKFAELNMNDSKLLLVLNKENDLKKREQESKLSNLATKESLLLQRFNISNDHTYSILKHTHKPKVRATISNLNIEHSQPAINLQSPFYKVNLPRTQLRFFHRPKFSPHVRIGSTITFSKLKTRKRKKDKGKSVRESFATTQDLTVGDSAAIYLMEYSEQTPLALSKYGMANKLINYYRKTSEDDTLRPKLSVGETHVLGVQDKSPFWNFGFVEPGHIVPTLYNNMIRAPVFKHEVSDTDFLMVRSVGHGINRFYLRNINHLFTVGQTFPVVEIPGPNSRRVTSLKSIRLRMIVYRILNKVPERAISIEPIAKHFPDQDYGQNRQKIKEFMKYQREGPDKGLWKLKEGEPFLDKDNTKKLLSPEQIAEVEAMSQGLQFMEDNENFNFDDKLVKLEEKLLPWNISRNFVNATQMRAMVQIHGVGDPTGCGEGFSFLKTSMKGGFIKSNNESSNNDLIKGKNGAHTYNIVQQQKAYDDEIIRTWYTHAKSLSIVNPFEELDDPDSVNPTNRHVLTHRDDNKILRIVRKRRDENGIIQRDTIIIRDPRVIKGYLKGKELRKKSVDVATLLNMDESKIDNLDEIEFQKKVLQNELASLEKSQQRRAARGNKKRFNVTAVNNATSNTTNTNSTGSNNTTNNVNSLAGSSEGKGHGKNTTRRCATCGQIGHIRTNKSCPMYNGGITSNSSTPAPNVSDQ
ncbi:histone acetyltransferase PWA37_002628 [Arxiozyma heterogenica]|uniref:histone acetyltransferase n=1 Tax=Arxiozyma heterogenica TaxID=278026 RepID=UPI002EE4A44D